MQKFTEFIKQHQGILERNEKETKETLFNSLMEAKLKEYGANSIMDLTEEELEAFNLYVKTIKEDLSKADSKKDTKSETSEADKKVEDSDNNKSQKIEEDEEVTDEKSFREYAEGVLKKAHGDDYDQNIADKVINGLIDKVGKDGDWGQAIGRLTSGLGK